MALSTDAETLAGVALLCFGALVVGYLGYRIRYRGDVFLVAGYDPESVTDPEGLGDFVGGVVLALGGVTAVYAVGLLADPPDRWFWGSYLVVFAVAILVLQVRGRRYAA